MTHGDPDYQRRHDNEGIKDWIDDAKETVNWAKEIRPEATEMLRFGIAMKRWLVKQWWFKLFVKLEEDV